MRLEAQNAQFAIMYIRNQTELVRATVKSAKRKVWKYSS